MRDRVAGLYFGGWSDGPPKPGMGFGLGSNGQPGMLAEYVVLVLGTGGVSLFALVFARALGARVLATTSQESKADALAKLGASDVLNYRTTENWGEVAFELTGGISKVVNAAGGVSVNQSLAALGYGGEMAIMGLFSDGDAPTIYPFLMAKGTSWSRSASAVPGSAM